jgi:hypothetical protein
VHGAHDAVRHEGLAQQAHLGVEVVAQHLAVLRQAHVLDDDRDVVHAVLVGQGGEDVSGGGGGLGGGGHPVRGGGAGSVPVRVVQDQHAGQAAAHLLGGDLVRVRVVPEGGGGLVRGERDAAGLAGQDRVVGAAVCVGGDQEAVPVDGRLLVGVIRDDGLDGTAALQPDGGAQVVAVVTPRVRRDVRDELTGAAGGGEGEAAVRIRLQERRDGQRGALGGDGDLGLGGARGEHGRQCGDAQEGAAGAQEASAVERGGGETGRHATDYRGRRRCGHAGGVR